MSELLITTAPLEGRIWRIVSGDCHPPVRAVWRPCFPGDDSGNGSLEITLPSIQGDVDAAVALTKLLLDQSDWGFPNLGSRGISPVQSKYNEAVTEDTAADLVRQLAETLQTRYHLEPPVCSDMKRWDY